MHPTEGAWQEYLDLAADPPGQRELGQHLSACGDCQRTAAELKRRSAWTRELLNHLQADAPARSPGDILARRQPGSRRSLLAAAVLALCLVTAAGATVRAGLWRQAMFWLRGPPAALDAPAPAGHTRAPEPASSTGIAFQAAGRIEVAFEERPRGGEIEIVLRDGPQFSVTASEPVEYSVRQGRVAVANRGVAASYRIVLPQQLAEASIRIADRVVFTKVGPSITSNASRTGPGTYVLPFSSTTESLP